MERVPKEQQEEFRQIVQGAIRIRGSRTEWERLRADFVEFLNRFPVPATSPPSLRGCSYHRNDILLEEGVNVEAFAEIGFGPFSCHGQPQHCHWVSAGKDGEVEKAEIDPTSEELLEVVGFSAPCCFYCSIPNCRVRCAGVGHVDRFWDETERRYK